MQVAPRLDDETVLRNDLRTIRPRLGRVQTALEEAEYTSGLTNGTDEAVNEDESAEQVETGAKPANS